MSGNSRRDSRDAQPVADGSTLQPAIFTKRNTPALQRCQLIPKQVRCTSSLKLPTFRPGGSWMYTVEGLRQRIRVARGDEPADLVLRNARLVNVCSGECYPADIALAGGHVAGISEPAGGYHGQQER